MRLLVCYLLVDVDTRQIVRGCSRVVHVYDREWSDIMASVWSNLNGLHEEDVAITSVLPLTTL